MPPRTPYEESVAAIWSDVLGCADIGVYDDFFELSGHSLLAPKVVSRIRKVLGVQIPVMDFFARPTVAALASEIAAANGLNADPVQQLAADTAHEPLADRVRPGRPAPES
jgi:Phosphopantetheine attachment site